MITRSHRWFVDAVFSALLFVDAVFSAALSEAPGRLITRSHRLFVDAVFSAAFDRGSGALIAVVVVAVGGDVDI